MKIQFFLGLSFALLTLTGCQLSEEEKQKLNDAQLDLERLADQIIVTYPSNSSTIVDSVVTVKVDIPASTETQEVALLIDGVEVGSDVDGAPWEISWPSYYWADGKEHTLLLKALTSTGNELRNNQQLQVKVDVNANKDLKIADKIDGRFLKDTNRLAIEFAEFPKATSYELSYSKNNVIEVVKTPFTSVELTDMDVGIYEIKYRALAEFANSTTLAGPWSDAVVVEFLSPELPVINPPAINQSNEGYDLLLSWQDLPGLNTYNIYLNDLTNNNQIVYEGITENSFKISDLGVGRYEWQLERKDSLNHKSLRSEAKIVDIGVFTLHLGGSKNDGAKQLIPSNNGGFIVLGYTKSYEISEAVDPSGDDWIIKVDSQGEVEWEYISNAMGQSRLEDIVELSDGSIILVGQDWQTKKAIALKINADGDLIWEINYRPEGLSEQYDFLDVVEFNSMIYVSGVEWGAGTCAGCTKRLNYFLHTLSSVDGSVSSQIDIPDMPGLDVDSIKEMVATTSGKLLLSGYAYPSGYKHSGGGYFQLLDSSITQTVAWNNAGISMNANMGDAIELSNGDFAMIGQAFMGGEPAISVIGSNGSTMSSDYGANSNYYYSNQSIYPSDDGGFYGFFIETETEFATRQLALVKFGADLNIESRSYLLGHKKNVSPSDLVKNNDGTFTFLYGEYQDGNNNLDIVLVKSLMN